jgi:hypothetical protein
MKKYVTFNKYNDIFDVWAGVLEHDKDYIVIGYITKDSQEISSTTYTVRVGNKDVDINSSFFYPEPSREELLPSKVDAEEESSFDNLVRSDYIIQKGDYFVLNKLSEEQKKFLSKELPVYGEGFFSAHYDHCYYDYEQEFVACSGFGIEGKELSFNLLFVEKSS